jgi:hypothetical protein
MTRIRTSLQSRLPRTAMGEDELHLMRRKAWRDQGVAVLPVAEIMDDWLGQAVTNEANRRYGRREQSR